MVLIFLESGTDNIRNVASICYQYDNFTDEQKAEGIEIEESLIPTPQNQTGKTAILQYDTINKTLIYNYVDRELTDAEKVTSLQSQVDALNVAIANLIGA